MIGILAVLFFTLVFLSIAGVISLPFSGRKKNTAQTGNTPAPQPSTPAQPVVIDCPQCSAKLRVSGSQEMLKVTCPKCNHSFFWYNTTTRTATDTPVNPSSNNELDAYREGGALRLNPYTKANTVHDAAVALIATLSGSMIANSLFGHEGELWELLKQNRSSIDFIDLLYTKTGVIFTVYLRNAPVPHFAYEYTYNEFIDHTEDPAILLEAAELPLVRRMALSHLADLMPNAYMREGRIYERKQ